jgi:hypothetical protein
MIKPPCITKEFIDKFLLMNDQEIEMVYLLIREHPCAKKAYDAVKIIRKNQRGKNV